MYVCVHNVKSLKYLKQLILRIISIKEEISAK